MEVYLADDNVASMSLHLAHLSEESARMFVHWAVQPIIDLGSTERRGLELLARNPDAKTASGSSIVNRLSADGRYELFRQGIEFAQQYATGRSKYHVNLAAADCDMVFDLEHFENLVIELTEGTINGDNLDSSIRWIQAHGGTVALDDLGAPEWIGDLDALIGLPWDLIKLDRSFLGLDSDHIEYYQMHLASHSAPLCLEGIERESDLSVGTRMGASLGQGYHFGRPQIHQSSPQFELSEYQLAVGIS